MGIGIDGILNAISIGASIVVPEAGSTITLVRQIYTALRANGVPIPEDLAPREHEINMGVITLDVDTTDRIAAWRAAHPAPKPQP